MSEINSELIDKINALAKKKKEVGLTPEELAQQAELRQLYLKEFRQGFTDHLKSIKVVDKQGKDVTPEKLKREKLKN